MRRGKASSKYQKLEIRGDESGQALVEYILLVSFSLALAMGLARTLTSSMDNGTLRIGAQLERDLKSGRAVLGVWKN
jgi:hypothetical protein